MWSTFCKLSTVEEAKAQHTSSHKKKFSEDTIVKNHFRYKSLSPMAGTSEPSKSCLERHMAVRLGNYIVLLGENEECVNGQNKHEIWTFNLWTEHWTKCALQQGLCMLPAVGCLCPVAIRSKVYIFGESGNKVNMWKLERNKDIFMWSRIGIQHLKDMKTPSPRKGPSCWAYAEKMWIFWGVWSIIFSPPQ